MEIENEINIEKNNFLNNIIGQTINNAIDIGLKAVLPDLIENQVIEIKDALLKNGLKAGVETAVNSAIDFGKSISGIFTGNFENMTQVRIAVSEGGILETISEVLDKITNKTYEAGYINKTVNTLIKNGKDIILDNISNNIRKQLDEQTDLIENLNRYIDNWKENYNNQNFIEMEKEYNKIEENIDKIIPLENIIKEIREIESIHNLIKNNGQNFEISDLEKTLAKNLV